MLAGGLIADRTPRNLKILQYYNLAICHNHNTTSRRARGEMDVWWIWKYANSSSLRWGYGNLVLLDCWCHRRFERKRQHAWLLLQDAGQGEGWRWSWMRLIWFTSTTTMERCPSCQWWQWSGAVWHEWDYLELSYIAIDLYAIVILKEEQLW